MYLHNTGLLMLEEGDQRNRGFNMSITIKQKGDLHIVTNYLKKDVRSTVRRILEKYGQRGVEALSSATPVLSGLTANSWSYEVHIKYGYADVTWYNSNVQKGYFNVALMLQMGHGTKQGVWVEGIDYINPAIQPIFEELSEELWREVTKL